MHRKTIAICAALVAFGALAIAPAMSSAARLTDTNAAKETTNVANNSLIVGYNETNEATILNASGLKVECQEVTITGKVHTNGVSPADGVIRGTIEHAYFRGSESETRCSSTLGPATITIPGLTNAGGTTHWCIETLKEDKFQVMPNGCTLSHAGHVFTFIVQAGGITCGFSRSETIKGDFKTAKEHEAATLTLTEKPKFTTDKVTSHSIFCPASGELERFNFELFTDTDPSTPGTYHHAGSIADPVFITEK